MGLFIFINIFVFASFLIGIKNEMTCSVKIKFIWDGSGNYDKLPSYDRMLFTPHIWTYRQWREWIEKKEIG